MQILHSAQSNHRSERSIRLAASVFYRKQLEHVAYCHKGRPQSRQDQRCGDQAISGYLGVIADEGRFNPVCDMLRGQTWDGESLKPTTYQILSLTDPFDKTLVRKWMIQCVALAFNDEHNPIGAGGCLNTPGEQGIGKDRTVSSYSLLIRLGLPRSVS